MSQLWEVLRPPPAEWPQGVEHVASVYVAYGTNPKEIQALAKARFPDALAVRRAQSWDENEWSWI